jgi:hypothetical protein
LVCKRFAINTAYRAFLGGEKFITSTQYKFLFNKDKSYILCSDLPFLHKILVIFACMGFYQSIIKIVNRFLERQNKNNMSFLYILY